MFYLRTGPLAKTGKKWVSPVKDFILNIELNIL